MTDGGHAGLVFGAAVLLAWLWDAAFGEPRNALHPVAWVGRVMAPLGRGLVALPPTWAFVGGAVVWLLSAAVLALAAWRWQLAVQGWGAIAIPALALALKPSFAWRMLRDEVAAVETALTTSGLAAARQRLALLVSRDVDAMDAVAVRETAIETLAENLNDSVVAPLFWAAVAGLPGAVVYRLANTLDAMWGYRGRWEWAGKWAARADDALSWLPARLTALLLAPALLRATRHEAQHTPSPNGGWPMGAMALRLGVRLSKPGVYVLHARGRPPTDRDMATAQRLAQRAAWTAAALTAVAWWLRDLA